MRYVIIEDEAPAREQLRRDMEVVAPDAELVACYGSVREAVEGLRNATGVELVLCDIQLADGSSFDIFDEVQIRCPVVFCTAYDEYVMQAFATHGVDYLLKPIEREHLARAVRKVRALESHFADRVAAVREEARLGPAQSTRKQRLLARRGAAWVALDYEAVAYFTTEQKLVIAVDRDGQQYVVDGSLSELESRLDVARFFRASRRYIVQAEAVRSFRSIGKGRLALTVQHVAAPVVVSQENARRFKRWIEG